MQFAVVVSALLSVVPFAVAAPPACVINAIGVQGSDATDMEVLCETKQEYVLGNLTESCTSEHLEPAYEHYASLCLEEASVTVSALPSETGSSSGSSSSSSESGSGSESSSSSEDGEDGGNNENAAAGVRFAMSGLLITGAAGLFFL